jgi:predicted metal-dependent hydrolase
MRQDGVTGLKAWTQLLWYLWVRPGMFRKIAGVWLKFFMPGFHPWNDDDRALLAAYDASVRDLPKPMRKVRRAA